MPHELSWRRDQGTKFDDQEGREMGIKKDIRTKKRINMVPILSLVQGLGRGGKNEIWATFGVRKK